MKGFIIKSKIHGWRFHVSRDELQRHNRVVIWLWLWWPVEFAEMQLYNLTLQHTTASPQAIVGNFSGARQQEIIVSHGTRLQLLRPDVQTGKISTIITTDVFGSVRSLAAFRLTGGTKGKPL
jgi:hypothetical protein